MDKIKDNKVGCRRQGLSSRIKTAKKGEVIYTKSEAIAEFGKAEALRLGRKDLKFRVGT